MERLRLWITKEPCALKKNLNKKNVKQEENEQNEMEKNKAI